MCGHAEPTDPLASRAQFVARTAIVHPVAYAHHPGSARASASRFDKRPLTAPCSRSLTARSLQSTRMQDRPTFHHDAPRSTALCVRDVRPAVSPPSVVASRERGGFSAQRSVRCAENVPGASPTQNVAGFVNVYSTRAKSSRLASCIHVVTRGAI